MIVKLLNVLLNSIENSVAKSTIIRSCRSYHYPNIKSCTVLKIYVEIVRFLVVWINIALVIGISGDIPSAPGQTKNNFIELCPCDCTWN